MDRQGGTGYASVLDKNTNCTYGASWARSAKGNSCFRVFLRFTLAQPVPPSRFRLADLGHSSYCKRFRLILDPDTEAGAIATHQTIHEFVGS